MKLSNIYQISFMLFRQLSPFYFKGDSNVLEKQVPISKFHNFMLFLYVILKNRKEGDQPFFLPSGHQNYSFLGAQAFPETV